MGGLFIDNGKIIGYILIDQKVKGWSKDPGPSTGEEVPRLFLFWEAYLKELGLFIDESGDFGEYSHHSPYYIITMVFHNQEVDIKYKCFHIEKKHIADSVEATGKLSKQISQFIRDHYEEFLANDAVKIYYDNGQVEISKLLASVFNALLPNPIFRKVMPSDYKLFQAADFICTMELIKLKLENNFFSDSERNFFGNQRDLKQNYLKALKRKEWK